MGRDPVAPPGALVRALHHLLRPLVRLLLERQITYPFLTRLLKAVYVEVAEAEFTLGGRRPTDSRVSLLTGVHRKDVRRLRSEPQAEEATPPTASLGALVVSRWLAEPRFLDSDGRPRPLARVAHDGSGESFDDLVRSVSKDIAPRSLLDEWLRLGVVKVDDADRVALHMDAFVPKSDFDEKAHFFGRNLHDHIAAGAHNLLGGDPFLERSVFYDRLTPESVAELSRLARSLGTEVIQKVNRRALALQRSDEGNASATRRMAFGAWFYAEDEGERDGD